MSLVQNRFYLRCNPHLKWKRMHRDLRRSKDHHNHLYSWAENRIVWAQKKWKSIILTNEKRFTLVGHDCMAYYWAGKQCYKQIFQQRHTDGGELVSWGGFSSNDVTTLCFVPKKTKAVQYWNIEEERFLPFAYIEHEKEVKDFVI